MSRWLAPALLALIALAATACADQYAPTPTPTPPPDLLDDGVVATFETDEGTFKLYVITDPVIKDLFRMQRGEIARLIPHGVLIPGAGPENYNAPWDWHIHRQAVTLEEPETDRCDATPADVQADLQNWMDNIRRFCPASARLVEITDYR